MIRTEPHWKHSVYVTAATVLGLLVSLLAHVLLEMQYLHRADMQGVSVTWTRFFGFGLCALPPLIQYGLVVIGLAGGFFIGRVWWQFVYVERRHWWLGRKGRG